jgi:hypothetical protein
MSINAGPDAITVGDDRELPRRLRAIGSLLLFEAPSVAGGMRIPALRTHDFHLASISEAV